MLIRPPALADSPAFLEAARRSRVLHHPWVAPPANPQAYRHYTERLSSGSHQGFLVVHRQTGGLVGAIHLNHIIRARLQSAFLGYYAFADYAGQGLMQHGMQLVLAHAFRRLKLHRLEANIQPGNRASLALVQRCGFLREGFSRAYLKIGGRWKDHERWAILAEDWLQQVRRRSGLAHARVQKPDRRILACTPSVGSAREKS